MSGPQQTEYKPGMPIESICPSPESQQAKRTNSPSARLRRFFSGRASHSAPP